MADKKAETKSPGQPTKYDPRFIQEVDKYLNSVSGRTLPTIEGFAMHLKVDHDTINNWANIREKDAEGNKTKKRKYPQFFGAIKRIKTAQRNKLINDGFYGGKEVNAIMGIFLLKANHGMIEIDRIEHTGKDGKDLPAPILGGVSNVPGNNGNKKDK